MTGGGPANKGGGEDEEDRIVSRGEEDGRGGAEKDGGEALGSKGKLTLAEQTRPIMGGLILLDDAVEVNCTFETLVRLQKTAAAGEVSDILFR